jgi:uncharacterized tellurite resistance protein B-like protein
MAKDNIHIAMGSLAYAIAMADGSVQEEEKETIKKLAQKEFELSDVDNEWIIKMFNQLEGQKITLDDAYNYAIDTLEANRFDYDFDDTMKKKCVSFMQRVAEAFDETSNDERSVLHRFMLDIERF